jgi:transposase
MIVIGVDVHKQSVTAVATDEIGRILDERTAPVGSDELLEWAAGLGPERLWALEDYRRLTRWLERQLLAAGEQLVRVPPKLMAPERRHGRARGKSDPIDALARGHSGRAHCGRNPFSAVSRRCPAFGIGVSSLMR